MIYHNRAASCWYSQVKGVTIMVNGIYNGWRMETCGSTNRHSGDRHMNASIGICVALAAGLAAAHEGSDPLAVWYRSAYSQTA